MRGKKGEEEEEEGRRWEKKGFIKGINTHLSCLNVLLLLRKSAKASVIPSSALFKLKLKEKLVEKEKKRMKKRKENKKKKE